MIIAHYVEIRSQKLPGQPTETIVREVHSKNGHGRKTIRVLRGDRTVSAVTEPLTTTERSNIQVRRFTPNLYTSAETKTRTNLTTKKPKKATRKTKKTKRPSRKARRN
jgi:hypothetical protein